MSSSSSSEERSNHEEETSDGEQAGGEAETDEEDEEEHEHHGISDGEKTGGESETDEDDEEEHHENCGGEETTGDQEAEDGDDHTEEGGDEEPRLFRLSFHALLVNCDNMVPRRWDYRHQPMTILWECTGCGHRLIRRLHFPKPDLSYNGELNHLADYCASCTRIYWVRMDDSYNQPCTVGSDGVLMSFWVVGAMPITYRNPPLSFTVTVVVENMPHSLRVEPGPLHVGHVYSFMNLPEERRPQVSLFSWDFFDEETWAAEVEALDAASSEGSSDG